MQLLETFLVIGLIPSVWTIIVAAVRSFASPTARDDLSEKIYLGAMLVAPVIGATWLLVPASVPTSPLPLPEWVHEATATIMPTETVATGNSAGLKFDFVFSCLLIVYVAGVATGLLKLMRGFARLFRLERECNTSESGMLVSQEPISAFATLSGKVVVSAALLKSLSTVEISLIEQHERAHIGRRDPLWFYVLAALDCLFWFNPFVRHQTERCRLAAEIACDLAALKAAPEMRGVYARSLVSALKHTAGNALHCVPAAFSKPSKGDYRMRMVEIMRPSGPLSKSARTQLIAGLSLLMIPVGLVQVAIAETGAITAGLSMTAWPIEGKLTSQFGERTHPVTKKPTFHNGIDLAAAKGTPVKAAGAGIVVRAEFDEGYGNVVDVDHGSDVVTRYSQLDTIGVSVGESVDTAQVIGTVGASGKYATGPHLHFEVLESGKAKDPADYFKG